jgi:aarF domain-containing kinase
VTQLNETNRRNFLDLFRAVAEFDGFRAGQLMVERCRQPEEVIDADVFALKMEHLVYNIKSRTFALGNIKIGDVLSEVLSMVRSHHVRLEGDFVNVVISILLLEGIGRSLDPGLDLFKRYADTFFSLLISGVFSAQLFHNPWLIQLVLYRSCGSLGPVRLFLARSVRAILPCFVSGLVLKRVASSRLALRVWSSV